jgi:hypothetical protein
MLRRRGLGSSAAALATPAPRRPGALVICPGRLQHDPGRSADPSSARLVPRNAARAAGEAVRRRVGMRAGA